MKQCPHCRTSIEDDARFCLYCMTSLDTKKAINPTLKKKPLWALVLAFSGATVAVALVLMTAIISVAIFGNFGVTGDSVVSSTTTVISPTVTAISTTATTDATTVASTSATAPSYEAMYRYRTAELGRDYYSSNIAVAEDAIVITEVCEVSENGIYVIPDTIDGHPVLTVASLAFSDEHIRDTVKTVVFSSSVYKVESNAFAACSSVTDVYIYGNVINIDADAFPDSDNLTIHATLDCRSSVFQYYKNMTAFTFEEWNGGELL